MGSFRKALLINFASSSGATVVQFAVSIVLARLLTPEEVGVYSITIVLVNIAHVFREFGVSAYLQREKDLTREKIRSAMGVAYTTTWFIAALIFCSSGYVADYYGYPTVQPVMQVLALSFLFIPFSSIVLALLVRNYDATKIAWATGCGTLAYATTCLGLAYSGFGTMSLAWANLANILATGLAYLPMRPRDLPWRPSLKNSREVAKFGGGALLANLIKNFNLALPDLLLGKLGGAQQVGLVSRANSTVNIFLYVAGSAINFGSQAYLAKAYHEKQPLAPMLNRSASLITGIGWPILTATAILGSEIVTTLYGSAWIDAVPAIAPLSIAAAIGLIFHYNSAAFNAIGRPYLSAVPLLITAAARIGLALVFYTGDLVSFAWVLMWASVVTLPVWVLMQKRYFGCGLVDYVRTLMPSAVAAVVCGVSCILMLYVADRMAVTQPLLRILMAGPLCLIVWLVCLKILSHPLAGEIGLILKRIVPWK
ncbi:oligosaccharide flippase family protein [Pseudorhodoferax soli]|uniref:O-antigen/teichoic acid export membrane protein n=1 Tax=Pseudorhodoferax soli TaxID=545864 RepID=A0A368YED2_9BURK|nr:oligosaccharide flippase family protein [Pseudorhodoferax soli]RCW76544.1 O-antigen/teichoic acid export membrane protein [Pseudorhodoferax soli]